MDAGDTGQGLWDRAASQATYKAYGMVTAELQGRELSSGAATLQLMEHIWALCPEAQFTLVP